MGDGQAKRQRPTHQAVRRACELCMQFAVHFPVKTAIPVTLLAFCQEAESLHDSEGDTLASGRV
jgi:hypothetical protein